MEQLLKAITLYDLLACLVPGLIFVFSLCRALHLRKIETRSYFWWLIVIAYVTGQLLQTVLSEKRHWLPQPAHLYPVEELFRENPDFTKGKLVPALEEAFGSTQSKDWFYLCESYLQVRKLDAYTDLMHERYGFFRGLFLASVLSGVALLLGELLFRLRGTGNEIDLKLNVLLAALCFVGASLSLARLGDFDEYYGKATYETFYAAYKLVNSVPPQ